MSINDPFFKERANHQRVWKTYVAILLLQNTNKRPEKMFYKAYNFFITDFKERLNQSNYKMYVVMQNVFLIY